MAKSGLETKDVKLDEKIAKRRITHWKTRSIKDPNTFQAAVVSK